MPAGRATPAKSEVIALEEKFAPRSMATVLCVVKWKSGEPDKVAGALFMLGFVAQLPPLVDGQLLLNVQEVQPSLMMNVRTPDVA